MLAAAFALPLLLVPALPTQDAAEERSQELFAEAEFALEKNRYGDAVKKYKLIARKFPDTEAGKIAAERSLPTTYLGTRVVVDVGPSSNRVDVALMGDGYTLDNQKSFAKLADDVPAFFEKQKTFREYESYFNFRRWVLVSKDDNIDGFGREQDTALGGRVLGTIQGHVGVDHSLVKKRLEQGPENDGLAIVFVRAGALGTGGRGTAVIGGRDNSTTIHEWGHAFAGLGDEYQTKTHNRGVIEPRVNVSVSEELDEVPWKHWIEAKAKGVGLYEGAAGRVRDVWRPMASGCVMQDGEFFCPPCREEIVLNIYRYVDPIEWTNHPAYPREHAASLQIDDSFTFEVRVMKPRSHPMEVRWWILKEDDAPGDPTGYEERYAIQGRVTGDRRERGKLWPIDIKPDKFSHVIKNGEHAFTIKATDLEPGRYRVICRARDATKLRGQKLPWVLKDDYGLLESERAWWITIPGGDVPDVR